MNSTSESVSRHAAVLSACNLKVFRGERCVCREVNFTVQAGERLEITGANGSGKTSLLRVLAGLSEDYVGSLAWRRCVRRDSQGRQFGETSYIAHKTGFKDTLTVQENLRFYIRIRPGANEKRDIGNASSGKIEEALYRLGVGGVENEVFGTLSEGQRRRVVLARLLVEATVLWLLDEPTAALDQEGVAMFEKLLAGHADRGGVAVVATHGRLQQTSGVKHLELTSIDNLHREARR